MADDSPFIAFRPTPASSPRMAADETATDEKEAAATVAPPVKHALPMSHDETALPAPSVRRVFDEDAPIVPRRTDPDEPLPLRDASNFGGDDAQSVCSSRAGAWHVAALNFNAKRVPFSPFDEEKDGKLGSVYTRVTETLLARGDWERRPALRNKATGELKLPSSYGLLLGTAQGKGIPWGRLGYGIWPPPLVNYTRGFDLLTRKGKLAATLTQAAVDCAGDWPSGMPAALTSGAAVRGEDKWELAPASFVFHPSKGEANPYAALRAAYESSASTTRSNLWILKPSEGAKGEGIFILDSLGAIEEHLNKQEARSVEGEAVSSWVVQRYIDNPLLLRVGQRKFDMRCWVLVDAAFNVFLYRHGVLRCASATYDPSNVGDRFSHLTNHCIATEHPDYGTHDSPTNELFYDAFDQELAEGYPEQAAAAADGSVLESIVLPQIKRQVVQTMLAARERLEGDGEYYRQFHMYGYDFLVDADLRVWLCEINASPAVADELLPGLVDSLIRTAVDPFCPPNDELISLDGGKESYDAKAKEAEKGRERFELIFDAAAAKATDVAEGIEAARPEPEQA